MDTWGKNLRFLLLHEKANNNLQYNKLQNKNKKICRGSVNFHNFPWVFYGIWFLEIILYNLPSQRIFSNRKINKLKLGIIYSRPENSLKFLWFYWTIYPCFHLDYTLNRLHNSDGFEENPYAYTQLSDCAYETISLPITGVTFVPQSFIL